MDFYQILLTPYFEGYLRDSSFQKYWELNSHYQAIATSRSDLRHITEEIKKRYAKCKMTEVVIEVGKVFSEPVSIHTLIISSP